MRFESFRNAVETKIKNIDNSASLNLSPFFMGDREALLSQNPNPRLSAVMILIYNKDEQAHLVLIERPTYKGVHSGQIAFPGGSKDPEDANLEVTALRELHEEVGVQKGITVLGEISKVYIPPSKFLVTPYIGISHQTPNFKKDDFEVKQVIEVPISLLFDDSIIKKGTVDIGMNNLKMKVPYFDIYGHKVWGATAIILSEFKALMK